MSRLDHYHHLLAAKAVKHSAAGFEPTFMPDRMRAFQERITRTAVQRGRYAIFADCGLGKTFMQLVWSRNVVLHSQAPVLILCPLAVAAQTQEEARRWDIPGVRHIRTADEMVDSNGISLHDASPNAQCNSTYPGPYIRWSVIRGNSISGVAASNPGICGSVNASNPGTSDLLVELNTFGCPPGNLLPGDGLNIAAAHSVVL
jgi:hypothetical protein